MDSTTNSSINCSDCGLFFPCDSIDSAERSLCPECGSYLKTIHHDFVDESILDLHECITGKIKDKNFNSKKNPRYEFIDGHELRKSDNKWMQKSRTIDKINDNYTEKVADLETGEVVHSCEEPLSKHFGHGSAKPG